VAKPSGPAAPLTGLPASSAVAAAGPAVAIVVAGPKPQGLNAADVIWEEVTNPVRYIAVYQSQQADNVGPVTTTQPTDRMALAVLRPLVAYHGADAKYFIKLLDGSSVTDMGASNDPKLYKGSAGNYTVSTRAVVRAAAKASAPPSLFPYWSPGSQALSGSHETRPSSVRLDIPGLGTQRWTFDAHKNRWLLTRGAPGVAVANLVIQTVPYKQIKVGPKAAAVPSAQVVGTGQAQVFSGSAGGGATGTAATGIWSKPKVGDVTNYFDMGGAPMVFEPGPTWIVLAPNGTTVTAT
jgi:hypothetical protein